MLSKLCSTGIVILTFTILALGCTQEENITKTQTKDAAAQQVPTKDSNILETPPLSATTITPVTKQLQPTTIDPDPNEEPVKSPTIVIDSNVEASDSEMLSSSANSLADIWTLDAEVDKIGPEGVSPEAVMLDDGTVRLYVTSMGIEIWESSDGLSFTRVSARTPPGSDPTVIRTSNGWRMYFTEHSNKGPDGGGAQIRTAISTDGIDWVVDSDTGIVQETDRRAWGVPDSFVLPNGQIRIMWTDMVPNKKREVIRSATSPDGISFIKDAGLRLFGGFVDSYVLTGTPNFMLVSTTPPGGPISKPQRLFLARSENGLDWTTDDAPLLDRTPRNALDPTAVYLGVGNWRIYYVLTDGPDPFQGFRIASAILSSPITPGPEPTLSAPLANDEQNTAAKEVSEATCEDTRYTFEDLGVVLTAQDVGNPDSMAPMANPSSLQLPDGDIRLFFTNAGAGIGSAISTDGITFSYEGIRISAPEAMNQGVNLGPLRVYRLPDNRIRLFVGSSQTGVQSFVSDDEGQTFAVEPGERIAQADAEMKAVQKLSIIPLENGKWQGYFGPAPQHGPPGEGPSQGGPPNHWLRRATSSNLFDWTVEPGIVIGPGAPHLTASAREVFPLLRDDGCVTLFYQLNKPQDAGIRDFTGVAVIGYSTSENGTTFKEQQVLVNKRDPAGPDIIRLLDQTYLMYHDSTERSGYGHGIRVGRLVEVDD
jgi:hypothetical protein